MIRFLKVIVRNFEYLFKGRGLGILDKIKLKFIPRFKQSKLSFFSKPFELNDSSSFVSTYEELFIKKIYEFKTDRKDPLIIDCGANIGLSAIYFKKLYPAARIIAFEPDETIFRLLKKNVLSQNMIDIELHQKAVWILNGDLTFFSQGGLSGHIVGEQGGNTIQVPCIRLRDYLNQPIDFLKIDIEGAEYEVLKDVKDLLIHVKYLFVEYHSDRSSEQCLDEILKILKESGFRYHIQEAFSSEQPFMGVRVMLDNDLQLNVFAYKESRYV